MYVNGKFYSNPLGISVSGKECYTLPLSNFGLLFAELFYSATGKSFFFVWMARLYRISIRFKSWLLTCDIQRGCAWVFLENCPATSLKYASAGGHVDGKTLSFRIFSLWPNFMFPSITAYILMNKELTLPEARHKPWCCSQFFFVMSWMSHPCTLGVILFSLQFHLLFHFIFHLWIIALSVNIVDIEKAFNPCQNDRFQ